MEGGGVKVRLHIERLVLDGVPDAQRVGDAIARELERLVQQHGIPDAWRQGGSLAGVKAPEARIAKGAPRQTGRSVAQSILGGAGDAKETGR
jgi:hypothetical protein